MMLNIVYVKEGSNSLSLLIQLLLPRLLPSRRVPEMPLSFTHLTSAHQVTKADADAILQTAHKMQKVVAKGGNELLKGKVLASLFFEPSTRTRLSFESAMERLGGQVITADGLQFSSLYKGETVEDTIKVIGGYADIITMRHPDIGSADKAASVSPVPFINAGDGANQHPTQALLDLFTIQDECEKIDGVHVAMVGDLKFGRTVHSLTTLLTLYKDVRFTFVSPDVLKMPAKVTDMLKEKGISYEQTDNMEAALDTDVIYMTRVQKERFEDIAEYEKLKHAFVLEAKHLKGKNAVVMHPLPRVGEISTDVDALPNAAYFRQAHNGVPVRMALIAHLLDAA
jgi:aspartate carbamoyltransferase catalytic subunit